MPASMQTLLKQYTENLKIVYSSYLKTVILYGSYTGDDYQDNSDINIMILPDLSDMDIKKHRHQSSNLTYDFDIDNDLNIKPIARNRSHFEQQLGIYPFYTSVTRERVRLSRTAQ